MLSQVRGIWCFAPSLFSPPFRSTFFKKNSFSEDTGNFYNNKLIIERDEGRKVGNTFRRVWLYTLTYQVSQCIRYPKKP